MKAIQILKQYPQGGYKIIVLVNYMYHIQNGSHTSLNHCAVTYRDMFSNVETIQPNFIKTWQYVDHIVSPWSLFSPRVQLCETTTDFITEFNTQFLIPIVILFSILGPFQKTKLSPHMQQKTSRMTYM